MSGAPPRASWSPLACHGTALAPPVLLAAKLLVLYAWVVGIRTTPRVHLPFLPFLDALPDLPWAPALLGLLFPIASAALLLNRGVRLASFACGALVLASILCSRISYSNNKTLFGLLWLWIALQDPRLRDAGGRWMFRAQLALVYLGAGLNKLLDPDWRSGRFFEHWTHADLRLELYPAAAALLPAGWLSQAMSWGVIAGELGLAGLFAGTLLRAGLTAPAVAAGLGLHVGMLVFTAGKLSWPFLYAMAAAYLCLADPRTAGTVPEDGAGPAQRLGRLAATPAVAFAAAGVFFALRAWQGDPSGRLFALF